MNDLVSIVTPVFNAADFLEQTIASVQSQTHVNWEWILIDDASSDQSVTIIQVHQKKDPRIHLITLKANVGSAQTRNLGIEKASGKYLTFLDADDLWLPHFIQTSIQTIQQTNIPFVFASYHRLNEQLEPLYSDFIVPNKVTYTDILKSNSISCLTAFVDVQTLGKKFMPNVRKRQDMGLWLQYLKEIPYAYGIAEVLAIYRIRKNSLSRNKKALLASQWYYYRKVEKLSFLASAYYMTHWMVRGFLKYRN
ncbi:MAG: glycosyltransferase family 2 protein [Flavobacterium sp.]